MQKKRIQIVKKNVETNFILNSPIVIISEIEIQSISSKHNLIYSSSKDSIAEAFAPALELRGEVSRPATYLNVL